MKILLPIVSLCLLYTSKLHIHAQTEVPVEILSHSLQLTNHSSVRVLGEVKNTHENPLCFVTINIEYLDEFGKKLSVERFTHKEAGEFSMDQVMASRSLIPPGQTSPFERVRDVSKIQGKIASCKVNATGLLLKETYSSAEISDIVTTPESSALRIRGIFTARGQNPCKNPTAVIVGYNKENKIITLATLALTEDGSAKGTALKTLEPGKAKPFELLIPNPDGHVAEVKAFPSFDCD